jgi:hypothetical protein
MFVKFKDSDCKEEKKKGDESGRSVLLWAIISYHEYRTTGTVGIL